MVLIRMANILTKIYLLFVLAVEIRIYLMPE
jgi:hypothetical protein